MNKLDLETMLTNTALVQMLKNTFKQNPDVVLTANDFHEMLEGAHAQSKEAARKYIEQRVKKLD